MTRTIKAKCTGINVSKWDKNTEYSYSFQHGTDKSKTKASIYFSEIAQPSSEGKFEIDKEYTITIS